MTPEANPTLDALLGAASDILADPAILPGRDKIGALTMDQAGFGSLDQIKMVDAIGGIIGRELGDLEYIEMREMTFGQLAAHLDSLKSTNAEG